MNIFFWILAGIVVGFIAYEAYKMITKKTSTGTGTGTGGTDTDLPTKPDGGEK